MKNIGKSLFLPVKWLSFAKNGKGMNTTDFDRLCSGVNDGNAENEKVTYVLDNLFYERFGMSYYELAGQLCRKNS